MVIIMKTGASPEEIAEVTHSIAREGMTPFENPGVERKVIAVLGIIHCTSCSWWISSRICPALSAWRSSRSPKRFALTGVSPQDTVFEVASVPVGGKTLAIFAGPCSIESEEQAVETARAVKAAGANFFRGGPISRARPLCFPGAG